MKFRQFKTGNRDRSGRTCVVASAVLLFCIGLNAQGTTPVTTFTTNLPTVQPVEGPPPLDAKRLFALGMIETGNKDGEVGKAGEVSRYQIHPTVWKVYSRTANYQNTEAAIAVARQHWASLAGYFLDKTGRQPSDFDMYVMWNTRFGYYARRGFSAARLGTVVRDRAQRFVNLVNRKG